MRLYMLHKGRKAYYRRLGRGRGMTWDPRQHAGTVFGYQDVVERLADEIRRLSGITTYIEKI